METVHVIVLPILIFIAAGLYSSVGHGGGSGYLVAMAITGVVPETMKPAALLLNLIVSAIGIIRFYRAGFLSFADVAPFAITSVPLAFAGGTIQLTGTIYKKIVGALLLLASMTLFRNEPSANSENTKKIPLSAALGAGGGIGLLAGLTGVGGGIFLSPILLLAKWTDPKRCAGISSAFIWVNSMAGLMGHLYSGLHVPPAFDILLWSIAAAGGGLIGSHLGARVISRSTLRKVLAAVLAVAAAKFLFA